MAFDPRTETRILAGIRKIERIPDWMLIPRPRYPIHRGGLGGSAPGEVSRWLQIRRRLKVSADPPRWLIDGFEVELDLEALTASAKSGGWDSAGAILAQATPPANAPVLTSPTPGSVLEADANDEIVLDWDDVASATNYRVSVGTTEGGVEIVNADTTASSTYTLDAGDLPSDGSVLYIKLETFIVDTWYASSWTYLSPGSTLHLARIARGIGAVAIDLVNGPHVQLGVDMRTVPADTELCPPGGGPPVQPVPPAEPATPWSIVEHQQLCRFVMMTIDGVEVPVTDEPMTFVSQCAVGDKLAPSNAAYSELVSPTPGATLTDDEMEVTISSITGALEYYLQVGDSPGSGEYYSASLGTDTTETVTGLPVDERDIFVTVWTKLPTQPFWRRNIFQLTAWDGV